MRASTGNAVALTALLLGMTLLGVVHPPARADPPFVANVRVSDDTPADHLELHPDVATAAGTHFAVWESETRGDSIYHIYFARSTDGGATWSRPAWRITVSEATQFYPAIAVAPAGDRVFVVWQEGGTIRFTRSLDGGLTWPGPEIQINDGTGSAVWPNIAVDAAGNPTVVWVGDVIVSVTKVFASRSSDDGVTWSADVPVSDATGAAVWAPPSLAIQPNGDIGVSWTDDRAGDRDVYFARSADDGATWTDPSVRVNDAASGEQEEPEIAAGPAGALYATWMDDRNGDVDVYWTNSSDGGLTWSVPNRRVDDGVSGGQRYPALAAQGGTIGVAWADTGTSPAGLFFANSTDGGVTWSSPSVRMTAPGAGGSGVSLAAGPVVGFTAVWETAVATNLDIVGASSTDGGATWTSPSATVSEQPALQETPVIVRTGGGTLYVAWGDFRGSEEDLYVSRSSDDGLTWSPGVRASLDATNWDRRSPSLVVAPSGSLHLAWEQTGNAGDLFTANSTDGGTTWGLPVRLDDAMTSREVRRPHLAAILTTATLVGIWEDRRTGTWDVRASRSLDGGATWQPSTLVNDDVGTAAQRRPRLAVAGNGTVYAVWEDYRGSTAPVLFSARSDDDGVSWSSNVRVSAEAGDPPQRNASVAVDAAGAVSVVWEDYRAGEADLYGARSSDGGVTWTPTPLEAGPLGSAQRHPSVAASSVDVVSVAWDDNRTGMTDILFTNSTNGGASWNPVLRIPDASGRHANPALETDALGRPLAVWEDGRGADVDIYFAAIAAPPVAPPPAPPTNVHATLLGQDVRITWTLSSPEDDVDHYEVWRGDAYAADASGYVVLPAASNLPRGTAAFIDAATLPGQSHFYAVRAAGPGGVAAGDFQAAKFVRALSAGSSLVSVPLEVLDENATAVFQSLLGALRSVRQHDPNDAIDPWKAWHPGKPSNEFSAVDRRRGYWVNLDAPGEWRVAGRVPMATVVDLATGWNLVGYGSFIERPVSTALAGVSYSRLEGFDPSVPYRLRVLANADVLRAGDALWIRGAPGVWTVTN